MDWDDAYASGRYRELWDLTAPGAELVGALAALGVPDHGVMADLGCGAGTEAIYLASAGLPTVGVDLSEEALRLARRRAAEAAVKVDWQLASVLGLPLADRSVVFANDRRCLEVLDVEDRRAYAEEVARVVMPGGHFLLRAVTAGDDPIDADAIDALFPAPRWERGYVLPLRIRGDESADDGLITLIRRRSVRW